MLKIQYAHKYKTKDQQYLGIAVFIEKAQDSFPQRWSHSLSLCLFQTFI